MKCECDRCFELEGADAQDYAAGHLKKVAIDLAQWQVQYVCPLSRRAWLMDYPNSEYHGGGPPRLRQLRAAGSE